VRSASRKIRSKAASAKERSASPASAVRSSTKSATPASARFSAAWAVRSASISSERTVPPTASAASPSQIVE